MPVLFASLFLGVAFLVSPQPVKAHHAQDCSDVFTPLSSFVVNGVNNNRWAYDRAMNETGVPWEMLAAIHYRETSFSHSNPSNGQGIFQFTGGQGGPYPPGPVSDEEFYRQLKFMANKLQDDYVWRGSAPRERRRLQANETNISIVKDTLFSYNGRAGVYADQAAHFGYNRSTQPYEGSPYVMNRFDCPRARMGLITKDYGSMDGIDARYGAFTVFARLRGDGYWRSLFTYDSANDYSFVTSSATALRYNPGGTGSATIVLKNTGINTWYSDNNLPGDKRPTRLALMGYQNSPFIDPDANSLGTRNQVKMTPDTVAPGENATFTFDIAAPYSVTNFHHRFVPIINGMFLKDIGMNVVLHSDIPAWNPTSSSIDVRNFLPNQQAHAQFAVQNNSGSTWYGDGHVPAGKQPTRLATKGYQNSLFADTTDPNWLGTRNQIKMNEASVAPGQTATFDAWFVAPIRSQATAQPFHFFIIVGGVFTEDKGLVFNLTAPAADLSFEGVSATNPPATMTPGQTATATYTVKNTGNVVWHDELFHGGAYALRLVMNRPVYRSSNFYDSADNRWLSVGQVRKPTDTTWPGQTVTFTFSWKAPGQTGTYHEPFQLTVGGHFLTDYGAQFDTVVQ